MIVRPPGLGGGGERRKGEAGRKAWGERESIKG